MELTVPGTHDPLTLPDQPSASSDALFGSGHRSRREQSEIVMNAPAVGPHLGAATRNLQNQAEQVPARLLDGGFAGGDAAGVESIRSFQRRASSVRVDTLMTGAAASPYGVPRPVVNTCNVMPDASCNVPQMKSLAGVAANVMPFLRTRSPGDSTSTIAVVPDLTIEPSDFSTILASPPFLLPGVVLALRSASPLAR